MKGQISFDMGLAVIALALIIYYGFYELFMLNNRTVMSLNDESSYNHLLVYSDYVVKHTGAKHSPKRETVYHHYIDPLQIQSCNRKDYLGFSEVKCGLCEVGNPCVTGDLCIRRVVYDGSGIKMLMVCGVKD
ncbi:hypothetical protein J7K41_01430 [Candidatus Micrarchaeota archaeon]|nr:hypothetical protein [Candidatus Micrarchaeota archaeon]